MIQPNEIIPPFKPVEAVIRDKEIIVPAVTVRVGETALELTWANTKVRQFAEAEFDHVEFRDPEGQLKGMFAETEFMAGFIYHQFPTLWQPYVDEASYNWFVSMSMQQLEKELGL